MAGDGRNTDDVTLPLLFLFHKEGNILMEALKEYREVEVLLSDKARDRGVTVIFSCAPRAVETSLFVLLDPISMLNIFGLFWPCLIMCLVL